MHLRRVCPKIKISTVFRLHWSVYVETYTLIASPTIRSFSDSTQYGCSKRMGPKHTRRDTHFVCFPLVNADSSPQLVNSLARFRGRTTRSASRKGIESSRQQTDDEVQADADVDTENDIQLIPAAAHRPPGTFHLTLGTMDLSEQTEMNRAIQLLQEIDYAMLLRELEEVAPGNSDGDDARARSDLRVTSNAIKIHLQGLGAFNSAANARVFYAHPIDPSGRLYQFAETIRNKFKDARLITEARPLVLHATVANMSYANRNKRRGRGGRQARMKDYVDATEIINMFDNADESREPYVWAKDIIVDRVRICKMGAEKSDDEELGLEYRPVGEKLIFDNT